MPLPIEKPAASDSFNSFREILEIALERRVDFVLLGGDLFHDNKPSRNAERRCIEILREKVGIRSCLQDHILKDLIC